MRSPKVPKSAMQDSLSVVPVTPPPTLLPVQVCVLDIETENTDFSDRSKCTIAIVGVKVYNLTADGRSYAPGEFRAFLADELDALAAFLNDFSGPIIGHNLFEFDFQVLRPHVHLEGIIAKTVDTLYVLFGSNGNRLGGLSLDALCKENFGVGKTVNGASIPNMWKEGRRDEVIRYNENDCDLNLRLWWHMVSGGPVKLRPPKTASKRR